MTGFKESEVAKIIDTIQLWAKQKPEIDGVALVGSWARNQAHQNSDIDLMILTPNPELFFQDRNWFNSIPWHDLDLEIDTYYDRVTFVFHKDKELSLALAILAGQI